MCVSRDVVLDGITTRPNRFAGPRITSASIIMYLHLNKKSTTVVY